jgi:hypothetical protein
MWRMADEQNLLLIGELSPNFLGLAFKATIKYLSSRQSNFRRGEKISDSSVVYNLNW